jgi:hypothetical protein
MRLAIMRLFRNISSNVLKRPTIRQFQEQLISRNSNFYQLILVCQEENLLLHSSLKEK